MSLKAFHFFFIIVSILLSAYFGTWCIQNYSDSESRLILILGLASFASTVGLIGYLAWFLKKSKGLSYLAISAFLLLVSHPAMACSVCIGNSGSPMVKSANVGVLFLLAIVAGVLSGIGGLMVFWSQRAKRLG